MTARASFWRRSRNWPLGAQIAFAVLLILIGAVAAGALNIAIHGTNKNAPSEAAPTSTIPASTSPTNHSASLTRPTTNATTTPVGSANTSAARSGLVPLAIAPQSRADTYNRATDFGGFVDTDHDCQNTRAEVLIRTSTVAVTFKTSHDCTVSTGRWVDPWSGLVTTVAHDFQIDHTVRLANAWASGAWAWTRAERVAYANDLTDPYHLVPILSAENESKRDIRRIVWIPAG